jgi:hypothetical protein
LPTLEARRLALELYCLCYFAQLLPLPPALTFSVSKQPWKIVLWSGHLERLAMDELHSPLRQCCLAITCIAIRAVALRAKQTSSAGLWRMLP